MKRPAAGGGFLCETDRVAPPRYFYHVEMTPHQIREYWRNHAPQAKRKDKRR